MKKSHEKRCGEIMEILHEWHSPEAVRILAAMGVSERNWKFFMPHSGLADGKAWSFREIADKDGVISRVRAYQIVKNTEKRLRLSLESLK